MVTYGVFGAGGHGRETIPLVRDMLAREGIAERQLVFVVEGEVAERTVNGYPVMNSEEFLALPGERLFNVAIGNSKVRERISRICESKGAQAFSVMAASALVLDETVIGEGAILSPQSVVTSNVRIGRSFHANIHAYVTHDCVIGDFVTFGPGAKCNGNVHIGNHAYIGAGAMIRQGSRERPLVIGEGAVIGMGAVVLHDVEAFTTVVGNPARPMGSR